MKKIFTLLMLAVTMVLGAKAQDVNIPDANFKAALVGNASINTNGDGAIQVTEAEAFTGTLDVRFKDINTLSGIEAFTNITQLICNENKLTNLNVSACTALELLSCSVNPLTTLDISANTALTNLQCVQNQLSSLDVSANTELTYLFCNLNQLTSLDVSANTKLIQLYCGGNQITSLDFSANTALLSLNCDENQITNLNVSSNTALVVLQCVLNQITSLDVSSCIALTHLQCQDNKLTSLNLKNGNNSHFTTLIASQNPNLTCIEVDDPAYMNAQWFYSKDATASYSANCSGGCIVNIPNPNFKAALLANTAINTNNDGEIQCTEAAAYTGEIDVSSLQIADLTGIEAFTKIYLLDCSHNNLTNLDVSANAELSSLLCGQNHLTTLDVFANTALVYLSCGQNQLTTLDASASNNLQTLYCYSNQLTTLIFPPSVNRLTCDNNHLTSLDVSANTSLNSLFCSNNQITSLDLSACTNLVNLQCQQNQLTNLILPPSTVLSNITCGINHIPVLDVSANTALSYLECGNNQLSTLDVSQNPLLNSLLFNSNQLTTLNVSSNPLLKYLSCSLNQISSLDVSANHQLVSLECNENLLTSLNIKNGNNNILASFYAINNPSLTCIQVDDVSNANGYSGWNKDATATYSENCGGCPQYFASLAVAPGYPSTICPGESTNLAVNITGASPSNTYFDITYYDGVSTYVTNRVFVTGSNVTAAFSVSPTATTNYKLISIADASNCPGLIGPATSDTFEVVNICLPSISIADKKITEGNSGTTLAKLKVTISRSSTNTVKVNYTTADSTATAGSDYVAKSGRLTFTPGQTSKTIFILINGDTQVEPAEKIKVILSSPVNATIADNLGLITIRNDDVAPISENNNSADAAITTKLILKVTPNPAKDQVTVSGLLAGAVNFIELTDLNGRSLLKQKVTGNTANISIAKYAAGIYLLRYYDGNKWQQVKVIKE